MRPAGKKSVSYQKCTFIHTDFRLCLHTTTAFPVDRFMCFIQLRNTNKAAGFGQEICRLISGYALHNRLDGLKGP